MIGWKQLRGGAILTTFLPNVFFSWIPITIYRPQNPVSCLAPIISNTYGHFISYRNLFLSHTSGAFINYMKAGPKLGLWSPLVKIFSEPLCTCTWASPRKPMGVVKQRLKKKKPYISMNRSASWPSVTWVLKGPGHMPHMCPPYCLALHACKSYIENFIAKNIKFLTEVLHNYSDST